MTQAESDRDGRAVLPRGHAVLSPGSEPPTGRRARLLLLSPSTSAKGLLPHPVVSRRERLLHDAGWRRNMLRRSRSEGTRTPTCLILNQMPLPDWATDPCSSAGRIRTDDLRLMRPTRTPNSSTAPRTPITDGADRSRPRTGRQRVTLLDVLPGVEFV